MTTKTPANGAVAQAVLDLTERWAQAERAGATDQLREILADDFVGVGPLGFLLTKEQWVQRFESGDLTYRSFSISEPQARTYGEDAAVVIGVQSQDGTYQGRDIPFQGRATHIFVNQDGRWRAAGIHISPMGPPGGGPPGGRPGGR